MNQNNKIVKTEGGEEKKGRTRSWKRTETKWRRIYRGRRRKRREDEE